MPRESPSASEWLRERVRREEARRRMDTSLDWRTWVRRRFAAYWYALLVAFADVAGVAAIFSAGSRPASPTTYALALAFLAFAVYLEWELYRLWWPTEEDLVAAEEGRWAPPAAPPGPATGGAPESRVAEAQPETGSSET